MCWVTERPTPATGAGVDPGRVGQEGVGPVVAGQLQVHIEGKPVVDERRRDPHLQVPTGLEVGHPEIEPQTAVGPADGFRPFRLRCFESVADVEAVPAAGFEADIEDAHLCVRATPEVERDESVGIELLSVEDQ